MKISPTAPRSTVIREGGSVRILIPSRKNWLIIAFLGFWLAVWGWSELQVPRQLMGKLSERPEGMLFVGVWLTLWTAGGLTALYAWLWQLAGREVIGVSSRTLSVRREIFGVGRTLEFEVAQLKDPRIAPVAEGSWDARANTYHFGSSAGRIAFDYGARTHRFALGVDEAEAKTILATILPFLTRASGR
jgi:hypothetical protein